MWKLQPPQTPEHIACEVLTQTNVNKSVTAAAAVKSRETVLYKYWYSLYSVLSQCRIIHNRKQRSAEQVTQNYYA